MCDKVLLCPLLVQPQSRNKIPWKGVESAVSKTVSAMVRIETVQGTKGRLKAIASRGEGGEGGR